MKEYHNILIIRTDRIGDVILTTPAIAALRRQWPRARLTVLVNPLTEDLVKGNPDIDTVLVDDRLHRHRGVSGFWRLVQDIRRQKFDLAIVYHTKKRTNALAFLAGIPVRIGYHNNKWGFLLTRKIWDDRALGLKHETEYCVDLLRELGVTGAAGPIFVSRQQRAQLWAAEQLDASGLTGEKVIAVHLGASCPTKMWPVPKFIEVMKAMKTKYGCVFVLIGSAQAVSISQRIADEMGKEVLDLTGKTTVAQCVSLLSYCRLLLSNDSGPVHIAAALGTPVISIFTRNQPGINPKRWRPLGPRSRFIAPRQFMDISFAKGEVTDPRYLELIQAHEVLEEVDAIFKLC